MNNSERNLNYLEKQWLTGQAAERALRHFRKLPPGKRRWMLRHHDEKVIAANETWIRDDFDYLLGFHAIVEIALTIGFVDGLPAAFRKQHLPVLMDAAVRRFYEWNYPLDLPRRLRERMQTGFGYRLKASAQLTAWFYEFLELSKFFERDKEMESFLWALDDGWRPGCDFDDVRKALGRGQPLLEALQKPIGKKSELEQALSGFCKFITFSEGFSDLLSRMESAPVAAEAMWLAHGYWFRELDHKVGGQLKKALAALANWKTASKEKRALAKRVRELEETVQSLAVPPMTRWEAGTKEGVDLMVSREEVPRVVKLESLVKDVRMPRSPVELKQKPLGYLINKGHRASSTKVKETRLSAKNTARPKKLKVTAEECGISRPGRAAVSKEAETARVT